MNHRLFLLKLLSKGVRKRGREREREAKGKETKREIWKEGK
jgi:hypothetical protein